MNTIVEDMLTGEIMSFTYQRFAGTDEDGIPVNADGSILCSAEAYVAGTFRGGKKPRLVRYTKEGVKYIEMHWDKIAPTPGAFYNFHS